MPRDALRDALAAYRELPYWMQGWLWLAVDSAIVLVIARFWA